MGVRGDTIEADVGTDVGAGVNGCDTDPCPSFCGEPELELEVDEEEKKVGVVILEIRPDGIEMDGNALDNLFNALSPTDCERCCRECVWNAATIDERNRPCSGTINVLGPACHGVGSTAAVDARDRGPGTWAGP